MSSTLFDAPGPHGLRRQRTASAVTRAVPARPERPARSSPCAASEITATISTYPSAMPPKMA